MFECRRWEYHRRNFETLAQELKAFVRQFATSYEDLTALLPGDVPPSLYGATHFAGNGIFLITVACMPSLIILLSL
jgi:hypothetical protein